MTNASSPGTLRPCIVPQFTAQAMAFSVQRYSNRTGKFYNAGFVPAIHWPERTAYRWSRFPRKAKLTHAEALRYAEHALHYRQIRAAAKCRRHQLRESSFPFSIAAE
jgi:hypothetical protein